MVSDVFRVCLGDKFEQLSPLVKKAHVGSTRLEGDVCVERGNFIAQAICGIFRMPPATPKCHLVVRGEHYPGRMTWNRFFDDFPMNSNFYKSGDMLVERLGPINMHMALDVTGGTLTYTLEKTRIWGIPIPRFLSPKVCAVEQQEGDKYSFSVVVNAPFIGKLVSYRGDMSVETVGL